MAHELDDIWESQGKEKYFIPQFKNLLGDSGLDKFAKAAIDKLGIKDKEIKPEEVENFLNNLNHEGIKKLEENTGLSYDDIKKSQEEIVKLKKEGGNSAVSKVTEMATKSNSFNTKNK